MNTWWLLGSFAMGLSLVNSISIHLVARGKLTSSWAGYYRWPLDSSDGTERAHAHAAAVPVMWFGTVVTVLLVITGWTIGGFDGRSGGWTLAGLAVIGITLMLGYFRALRRVRRVTTGPDT